MTTPVLVGLQGVELLDEERALLDRLRPQGVILFRRNVRDWPTLRALCAAVQDCLADPGAPAIIAADHEGGAVSVLASAIGAPPSALALGLADDPSLTRAVHEETGRRLRGVGVNMALAPVCDLVGGENAVLATRAFGSTPALAAPHLREALVGLRSFGIATCAKHWPGHGRPLEDSHLEAPTVDAKLDELLAQELPPFVQMIEAKVDAIMAAHLRVPALDPDGVVASRSPRMLREWLRERLRFGGLALSDALEMGGFEGEPATAMHAGVDLLLLAKPVAACVSLIEALPRPAADASERILAFRSRLNPPTSPTGSAPELDDAIYHRARSRGARALWSESRDLPAWPPTQHLRWRLIDAASGDRLVREASLDGLAEAHVPSESLLLEPLSSVLGPPELRALLLAPPGRGDALVPREATTGEVDLCVIAALRPWTEGEWRRLRALASPRVGFLLLGDPSLERRLPGDRGVLLVPGVGPEDARTGARLWAGEIELKARGRW